MGSVAIVIEWADGAVDTAPTPDAILELIASTQWHNYTPQQMRSVLSDRAWKVTQTAIDPGLPLYDLFKKIEEAGQCWILKWEPTEEES